MTTIFAMLLGLSVMGGCAHGGELTLMPSTFITIGESRTVEILESDAEITDVYPDVIKDPRRRARAPMKRAQAKKREWVPERLPASTYLNVRPSAPMAGAGLR